VLPRETPNRVTMSQLALHFYDPAIVSSYVPNLASHVPRSVSEHQDANSEMGRYRGRIQNPGVLLAVRSTSAGRILRPKIALAYHLSLRIVGQMNWEAALAALAFPNSYR
jgi:hypothetical protein